jgi:predicted dehydrogenase
MIAHTSNLEHPIVRWENPFKPAIMGHGIQWHDDEIGVAGCLMSLVNAVRNDTAPTYGAEQARLDQEIILAIQKSAKGNGIPVRLPLDISEDET